MVCYFMFCSVYYVAACFVVFSPPPPSPISSSSFIIMYSFYALSYCILTFKSLSGWASVKTLLPVYRIRPTSNVDNNLLRQMTTVRLFCRNVRLCRWIYYSSNSLALSYRLSRSFFTEKHVTSVSQITAGICSVCSHCGPILNGFESCPSSCLYNLIHKDRQRHALQSDN